MLGITTASAAPTAWTGSGPGTATVVSDGTVHNPQFQYSLSGGDVHNDQTWDFHTTAVADGMVTLPYCWRGFHAFFQVTAHLQAYVTHNGVTTFTPLVNDGPVDCCTPPSSGFHYTGTVTLDVQAGDAYGFQFGGQNFDSDERLLGTFSVFSTTPPTCNAGGPYTALANVANSIQLNGTGSSDADNDLLTYKWTTDCANATFDDATSPTPTLTFNPGGACGQQCTVTLTVDDGCDSAACSATVTFASINVSIYSGFTASGGGAPYTGLVGSFGSSDVMFGTDTGFDWHPFGLGEFGADITGYLNVAADGTYTFTLNSDDGSILFIDGNSVVDDGDTHPPAIKTGDAVLTAGRHCFEIQFFECCGGPSGVDLILPDGVTYGCPPTCKLTCPPDITGACNDTGACGAKVSYSTPTTTGDCGGVTASCSPPSGSFFAVGSTAVTCTAKDGCGHVIDQCSFNVTVKNCSNKCPLSLGYWKNHTNAWPVTSLTLGTKIYSQAQLLAILKTSAGTGTKSDASLLLADQLIPAKLNLANGSNPCVIASTIAAADVLIDGRMIPITPKITPTTAEGKQMVSLANTLEQYNTGKLTPGCTP